MTYMNGELACERMHEVDIGTYLKADAAQLFSEVPTCVCVWLACPRLLLSTRDLEKPKPT